MRNARLLFDSLNRCAVFCLLAAFFACAAPTLAQTQARKLASEKADRPEVVIQRGHVGEIASMAVSPDGAKFATAEIDGTIKFWNVRTGDLVRNVRVEGEGMGSRLVFSSDGRFVATLSGQYTGVVLDWQSGKLVRSINMGRQVSGVCFARDCPLMALGCPDQSIEIWNWQTGQKIRSITTHVGWVNVVSLSNDGSLLACAAGQEGAGNSLAEIWNTQTGGLVRSIHTNGDVYSTAFSPDGKTIALGLGKYSGGNVDAELWDLTRGERKQQLRGRGFEVTSLAFSKDGSTITTADAAGIVRVWDTVHGVLLKTMGKREFSVPTTVSADGRFAAVATHSGDATVYEALTGKPVLEIHGVSHVMNRVVSCNNGQTLITGGRRVGPGSSVGELLFWDMQTGICTASFQGGGNVHSWDTLAASPDGRYVAASDDKKAVVWDVPARRLLATFAPPETEKKRITAVAISPNGRLLAIGGIKPKQTPPRTGPPTRIISSSGPDEAGFLEIWRVSDHMKLRDCSEVNGPVDAIALCSNGTTLIEAGVQTGIAAWDVNTGSIIKRYWGAHGSLYSVSVSSDGHTVAAAGYSETFQVWPRNRANLPLEFRTSGYDTFAVAVAPDGTQVVAGGQQGDLYLWSVKSESRVRSLGGNGSYVKSLAHVQHGAAIVSLDDSQGLRIWDASTGKLKSTLLPLSTSGSLDSMVDWIAYTPDGYYAGSAMCESCIRWRVGDVIIDPDRYRAERNKADRIETALTGKVEAGRYDRLFKLAAAQRPVVFPEEPAPKTANEASKAPDPNTPDGKLYQGLTTVGWMGEERRTARALGLVKEGLAAGANINLQGRWGDSALMMMSYCGDLDTVKELVRRGADLNLSNFYGSTALFTPLRAREYQFSTICLPQAQH
jgi:WD40 repeat protein